MIVVRRSVDRGASSFGWLDSKHTFSFGDYEDPEHMGFRALRVINEDRVVAGAGFGTHGHRDMEIVSYVLEGGLAHEDSMGHGGTIRPGDVQRMSAGTGVRHSEQNASRSEPVHFLQIWILPEKIGAPPGYEQKTFTPEERRGRLKVVASRSGQDGSVTLHQDAAILAGLLAPGDRVEYPIAKGRHAYVQIARGEVSLNGEKLSAGDGAAVSGEEQLALTARLPSELLVFDLA